MKICVAVWMSLSFPLSHFLVFSETTRILLSKNASRPTFLSHDLLPHQDPEKEEEIEEEEKEEQRRGGD